MPDARPLAGERYHLIGVAGRGLAPLAVAARHLGAEVTGCDRAAAPDTADWLSGHGFAFADHHSVDHLEPGVTVVSTSVADPTEPEVLAADAAGGRWHRTDLLAHVLRQRPSVGVTGSHGKGSVAALTAGALVGAGLDPLALLGVAVPDLGGYARLGAGPIVAEVDDSDLSLARVDSDVTVVTSLDDDHPHLDVSLAQKVAGVGEYVARARRRVVLGATRRADALAAYAGVEVWRYGREFAARAVDRKGTETVLRLRAPDGVRAQAVVRVLGAKLAMNAALAWAGAGLARRRSRRRSRGPRPDRRDLAADGAARQPGRHQRHRRLRRRAPGRGAGRDRGGAELFPRRVDHRRPRTVRPLHGALGHRYAQALGAADRVVVVPAFFHPDYDPGGSFDERWAGACRVAPTYVADHAEASATAMAMSRPGDVVVFFSQRASCGDGRGRARRSGPVKVLMTNHSLRERAGSESYLETVSAELRRLGHDVVLFSTRCGESATRFREDGFTVVESVDELPDDVDVVHGQHADTVALVRSRLSSTPLVFVTHSWSISLEDPLTELGAGAFVALNDLTHRRLQSHQAARGGEVVRLTQPVTVSFADGAREPIGLRPGRAVAVSRRMATFPTGSGPRAPSTASASTGSAARTGSP